MISVLLSLILNMALAAAPTAEMQFTQGNYSTGEQMTELGLRAKATANSTTFGLDLGNKQAFGESSLVVSPFAIVDLHERIYASASVLFSDRGILYPTQQFFGELFFKMGADKKWVAGLGGGSAIHTSESSERFVVADIIYYATPWLVFQGGARYVQSSPASTSFQRYNGAATFFWKQSSLLLRYERGREAYAVIGKNQAALFDFESHVFSSALTTSVTKLWSLKISAELYESADIKKTTGGLSLIHQF